MKLLIVTQTVDIEDPILGFFVRWIEEFAKHCEAIHVVALNVGRHHLPHNVHVHCLGKSEGRSKIVWLWRLWRHSFTLRHRYNAVFVHMNPEYVIYGGLLWNLFKKRVVFWYAHGAISKKLQLATLLSKAVVTSTPKGFRLKSKKRVVVGQGIDVEHFALTKTNKSDSLELVTVGRISKAKNLEFLLQVAVALNNSKIDFRLQIVGAPQTKEEADYLQNLKQRVEEQGLDNRVVFTGAISQRDLPLLLHKCRIFLNAGETGSLDKTLLEAIACGVTTFSSNEAYKDFSSSSRVKLTFEPNNVKELTTLITQAWSNQSVYESATNQLREEIVRNHSVTNLVKNITRVL